MSFRLTACALALFCAVGIHAVTNAATLYDVAADYSAVVNTASSTWSYRWGTALGGTYTLLDEAPGVGAGIGLSPWAPGSNSAANAAWNPSASTSISNIPYIGKNETGSTQSFTGASTLTYPDGAVMIHPDAGEFPVISWLAASDGTADITFRFADAHPGGPASSGITWYVHRNAGFGLDQLATGTFGDAADSGVINLNNIGITAGDRINFIATLESVLNSNATIVEASISFTPVPEPSSFVLLALASIPVLKRTRRRFA